LGYTKTREIGFPGRVQKRRQFRGLERRLKSSAGETISKKQKNSEGRKERDNGGVPRTLGAKEGAPLNF